MMSRQNLAKRNIAMISSWLLLSLISIVSCELSSVAGKYKVLQLNPVSSEHLTLVHQLHDEGELDFWKEPSVHNASAEVMIRPDQLESFVSILTNASVPFRVIVDDLAKYSEQIVKKQTLIAEKEGLSSTWNRALRLLTTDGKRDDNSHTFGLAMGDYYDYDELVNFMQRVHSAIPSRTRIVSIGKTVENREMQAIQFGNPADKTRPVIWIDAGIHAREWAAVHSGVYFIQMIANAILDNRDVLQRQITDLLKVMDIFILPVANPDGYQYTRVDPGLVEYRMWRKSRSKAICHETTTGRRRCCSGVDLNPTGTSFSACSEIYHGAGAFSEPETKNIRDAVMSSDLRGRIEAFITLHAYSQLLIYPYADRKGHYPEDIADLRSVASRAVVAMGEKFGTKYTYGTGPEIIYAYTGGSSDWAKETARIKYSYTIELRPSYNDWNGFVLSRSQLIPTARETFDGLLVIMEAVAKQKPKPTDGTTSNDFTHAS
ncbi:hypothetical protein M3Y95_00946800 [Aphelenchoides besseyi]|nr:hypothetical protein M3Y95_00946800 [Aphelenchoides besseyi]